MSLITKRFCDCIVSAISCITCCLPENCCGLCSLTRGFARKMERLGYVIMTSAHTESAKHAIVRSFFKSSFFFKSCTRYWESSLKLQHQMLKKADVPADLLCFTFESFILRSQFPQAVNKNKGRFAAIS